jgi:hypothetical protein
MYTDNLAVQGSNVYKVTGNVTNDPKNNDAINFVNNLIKSIQNVGELAKDVQGRVIKDLEKIVENLKKPGYKLDFNNLAQEIASSISKNVYPLNTLKVFFDKNSVNGISFNKKP